MHQVLLYTIYLLLTTLPLVLVQRTRHNEGPWKHHTPPTYEQRTLNESIVNNRPVIGILTQSSKIHIEKYGNDYVRKEYIQFLEMAGASVVILKAGQPKNFYFEIFKRINGVFFPGGGANVTNSSFAQSAHFIFELAKAANDKGDYFPIWGTCLGFEIMAVLTAKKNPLKQTDSSNLSLPLNLVESYNQTRMLGNAPQEIIKYLTEENITANFHIMSLLSETYRHTESLNKFYRLISTNKGRDGNEFVSTMEAYNYPFYGVQWHPEKPIFIKRPDLAISNSEHAIKVGQYFATFFVSEARKNFHTFPSEEEKSRIIHNDKMCLPKKNLQDLCGECACCKESTQHSWSTKLCLAAVTALCILLCICYVWPSLKRFPASELVFKKIE